MTTKKLKSNQKSLMLWACKCAERVLPYFEKEYPRDRRPRKAIEVGRDWVKGKIKFKEVRAAALAAHAAARNAEDFSARFAARAAGQAVATAHVPQHAFGAAYYATKVVAAADSVNAEVKIAKELDWQSQRLPKCLRLTKKNTA